MQTPNRPSHFLWAIAIFFSIQSLQAAPPNRSILEARSSLELVATYTSHSSSFDNRYDIIRILATRDDPDAYRFFRGILAKPSAPSNPKFIVNDGLLTRKDDPTHRFLSEHASAWEFFTKRKDFIDSPTLLTQIQTYPCVIPFAADYMVSKRDRFTPQMRVQLAKLNLAKSGEYFEAFSRYLKIRILDRSPDDVAKDSMFIRRALMKSLDEAYDDDDKITTDYYTLLEISANLAEMKNAIALQSMFLMMPRMDGHVAEAMSYEMASIALLDFDFFITHAHKIMKQDKIDDMLWGIWACDLDADAFKKKYAAKLRDPKYPYRHDINLIANGPPETH
ncbi:hypothetical protein LLG95_11920 [bacterium]|nr:hypothetical protein [bacterium]